jgi:hypothetical protein
VEQIDTLLLDSKQIRYDPFLQAQDIPHGYEVLPGLAENEQFVEFFFFDENNDPYGSWLVSVILTEENGRYQISSIETQ